MKNIQDINDNEIRVIGHEPPKRNGHGKWWIWVALAAAIIAVVVLVVVLQRENGGNIKTTPADTTNQETLSQSHDNATTQSRLWFNNIDNSTESSYLAIYDTVIDSLHLKVLTPYNATPELYVGNLNESDTNILLAAMAADIRRDNGKIVGAFVYAGEPLSWGLSKLGYCAISEGSLTLGVAENSPLFEQATEQGAYFFRQYAAVDNGVAVKNNPENAAPRRALCIMGDKYCVVTTSDRVVMNDFCTALAKLGVSDAIFLVGGEAHGWWRDDEGTLTHFAQGKQRTRNKKFMNYIVFRAN